MGYENENGPEVVVAGAGPTGLTVAHELALAGVDVLVVEKERERIRQVKGGALQPRSCELFALRGLLEPLEKRALTREPVGGHFAGLPVPLDCTPWRTRHPYPIGIPQWEIEEVVEERAVARGARVLRGTAVTGAEPGETGVVVTVAGPDGGTRRVRGRYLVACDGAHSTVRKALGLPFPGRAGTHRAVLADIRLSAVTPLVPRAAGHMSTLTRHADGYWATLVPLGGDRYRFTFGHGDRPGAERETPVTDEEIQAALAVVYGAGATLDGVENASRFGDATRQLEQYRAGRVLFAGEAAHIHSPLGGQGLNLGVQDAFNLGWKLAAVVQGRAADEFLDTYHAERHPAGASVLHHTSAQRVLAAPNPPQDVAALRDIFTDLMRLPDANRHLAGLMSGLSLGYEATGTGSPAGSHPLAGHRVPDIDLTTASDAGTPTRLSALFHRGHAILLDLSGSAVPPDLELPPRVDLVRATTGDDVGATVLLLRPDGYVHWAADTDGGGSAVRAASAGIFGQTA
ncbi:FAD-dependent monooxygenase [Streptomyces beihaiensis]|uniref:FAD-dependent monooxygenase n=1 Tax=Streptomyces beihaiensis TaxID=2984495 RepID=A0ABT3TS53_9ACTN|nr:FAD-dependent monooxygenase [Streptomyces beihaiensis]MCX3059869.1 FAD-dependent monooxygenase [Streptomyces beihaiensis]